ncbi:hypothetical protein F5887DRAFT_1034495 [Amanita rubescens]|nr:hypothetical protein F5887DRAFT_1034495 [Amanita rubescens]
MWVPLIESVSRLLAVVHCQRKYGISSCPTMPRVFAPQIKLLPFVSLLYLAVGLIGHKFTPLAEVIPSKNDKWSMILPQWFITNRKAHHRSVYFLIDNEAVLKVGLNMDLHSNQMVSLRINLLLLNLFSSSDVRVHFSYCPSHVGIRGNDRADNIAKTGGEPRYTGSIVLREHYISKSRIDANAQWRLKASLPSYRGRLITDTTHESTLAHFKRTCTIAAVSVQTQHTFLLPLLLVRVTLPGVDVPITILGYNLCCTSYQNRRAL